MDATEALVNQIARTMPKVMSCAQSPLLLGDRAEFFTFSQAVVIIALSQRECLSVSEIAANLGVSVPTASGVVDRLERRHLVERRHGVADRRSVNVHLAPAGKQLVEDIGASMRQRWRSLVIHLSDEEKEQFAAILKKIEETT